MISKKEICARRLQYLLEGISTEEALALSSAELLIDGTIKETTLRQVHGLPLAKVIACLKSSKVDADRGRELIQILIGEYEVAGWSISLTDDYLILE